jgi:acyl carrier protein
VDNTLERLTNCFVSVFPELDAQDVQRASTSGTSRWDSVNHVLLLSVVAEEFGIEFEPDQYEELTSFALLAEAVREQLRHA